MVGIRRVNIPRTKLIKPAKNEAGMICGETYLRLLAKISLLLIKLIGCLNGRQEAIALNENWSAACPPQGFVSRFHTHLTGPSAVERCSLQCETTFREPPHHQQGMQKQNRELHHEREPCESLTGALHAVRWTGEQPAPFWLLLRAKGSCTDGER